MRICLIGDIICAYPGRYPLGYFHTGTNVFYWNQINYRLCFEFCAMNFIDNLRYTLIVLSGSSIKYHKNYFNEDLGALILND